MKILTAFLIVITFSNCTLISYYKYSKAVKDEKVVQSTFKTEIPFREEKGLLIVTVEIENKAQNFLFDTGATTVLDEKFAKTIKSKKIGTQKHTDSGGKKAMLSVRKLDKLSVGGIDFSSTIISTSDISPLKKATCIDFVGILGANVMSKAVWQIDYQRHIITLTNSRDSLLMHDNQNTFNFYAEGKGTPQIRISANDEYIDEAELDTGSSGGIDFTIKKLGNLTTSQFIRRYGITYGVFSNRLDTSLLTVLPIAKIGGSFEVKDALISFSKSQSNSLIGNAFLRNYVVTIDWKRRELTLGANIFSTEKDMLSFGFSPRLNNDKIIIGSIYENSSSDKAGLRINDEILQINKIDLRNAQYEDYCQLIKNWKQKDDKELSITVRRGNTEISRVLTQINIKELILNSKN